MSDTYPIIVVGGGHAGCEAAAAAARMGVRTLLITMNIENLGKLSCNPAMGGIGKGQLIREIDALGGLTGRISDATAIQYRLLNRRKGRAMWSPRAQLDRVMYSIVMRQHLEKIPNLFLRQDDIIKIIFENNKRVKGVYTRLGKIFLCKLLIITTGTFLNGIIHVGNKKYHGGRSGERSSEGISASLETVGFELGRLKTGTPPRLDGRTIDYSAMVEQKGDSTPYPFSFSTSSVPEQNKQISCWITNTNVNSHKIIKQNILHSPLYNGTITSKGPRYCPSIEDKIVRFADKNSHNLFIEPEGKNTYEIYLNGFSTSLPEDTQHKVLKTIDGLKNCVMLRPGYSIEYDYFKPYHLKPSLESSLIMGLFIAGQINGTTGYEEAACQGLIAGINAALCYKEEENLILKRNKAYIGVLIDDLICKGVEEPYRMFTSRAEFRIHLRQDNADIRLTPIAYKCGLISYSDWNLFLDRQKKIEQLKKYVEEMTIYPEDINFLLKQKKEPEIKHPCKASNIILRPNIFLKDIRYLFEKKNLFGTFSDNYLERVDTDIKYLPYEKKEIITIKEVFEHEEIDIPLDIDYKRIKSLSSEAKENFIKYKPKNIRQAKAIEGISYSDISTLTFYLKSISYFHVSRET